MHSAGRPGQAFAGIAVLHAFTLALTTAGIVYYIIGGNVQQSLTLATFSVPAYIQMLLVIPRFLETANR